MPITLITQVYCDNAEVQAPAFAIIEITKDLIQTLEHCMKVVVITADNNDVRAIEFDCDAELIRWASATEDIDKLGVELNTETDQPIPRFKEYKGIYEPSIVVSRESHLQFKAFDKHSGATFYTTTYNIDLLRHTKLTSHIKWIAEQRPELMKHVKWLETDETLY